MADLFNTLAALFALFLQHLGGNLGQPVPIIRPTATRTQTAVATSTRTPTNTRTPSNTFVPTATPTATRTPVQSGNDPLGVGVIGMPPAQKLPAALLIFPLIRASATQDTRIEIVNLTSSPVNLQCFYVAGTTCNEVGFFVTLTALQPISWLASSGSSGNGAHLAPPFNGDGELKCVVATQNSDPAAHNAVQGRALVFDVTAQTIGYAAIAFRRLGFGPYTGSIPLDGVSYEQCPDRLHFHALSFQTGSNSDLVLVACSQNLITQTPSGANIQIAAVNEFENSFSGSTTLKCFNRIPFSSVAALRRSTLGTDTMHLFVRGTDVPVVGLIIERFTVPGGALSTSSNEPYLEGGRSANVDLP